MAQDVMVKEGLDEAMIRDGAALVSELDRGSWRPSSALWFYFPDVNTWRLLIASPEVDAKGPREAYVAIQTALANIDRPDHALSLDNIAVLLVDDALIALLRSFVATGPGIGGIRFSRNVINGHFIEDAFIYRLN